MTAPHFLSTLPPEEQAIVKSRFRPAFFPEGSCILQQGQAGDGCYLIEEGEVRLELEQKETDSDSVLAYVKAGAFLGELSLLDGQPRSASAYAQTAVSAQWFGRAEFEELCTENPHLGLAITKRLADDLTQKLRNMNSRLAEFLFADDIDDATDAMVQRAVAAQEEFALWPESKVDVLIQDVADTLAGQAEDLAREAVAETGLGNVADKTEKNRFASLDVARSLIGQPGAGIFTEDGERGVVEFAAPVGVVLGLIPLSSPVATMIFKTLICLKSRNALIVAGHRDALAVTNRTGEAIRTVLRQHGAPRDLLQWIRERTSRRITGMFMKHPKVSFILATGGPSMVRAAYSSGTPAIGVGSGNAPCWIAADADLRAAAECIVRGKSFDNGVICGAESNLVVDRSILPDFLRELEAQGAAIVTPDERNRLAAGIFDAHGHLRREVLGHPASEMADAAGIRRSGPIRLLVAPIERSEIGGPFAGEKLAPIVSLLVADGVDDALALCQTVLGRSGLGHSAMIHTRDDALAQRFGREITASRLLVNSPGAQGCLGISTSLTPSLTLGCGTFGRGSTTDNVGFRNLLNVKRLAFAR